MTPIESVFKEEDVTNVASKVLKEVTTKIFASKPKLYITSGTPTI